MSTCLDPGEQLYSKTVFLTKQCSRIICILGAIVSCLGFFLSTFAPSVPVLIFFYSIVGGVGFGLMYVPAVCTVGYYFDRRRALATGITVCGSGAGTFILAPLASALLAVYGWKGATIIFAGLCLQCAVCGAVMRPLPKRPEGGRGETKYLEHEDTELGGKSH